jgi:hypothetical protein
MKKKAVFGLVTNEEQANRVVDRLLDQGFSHADISVLYPDRSRTNAQGEVVEGSKSTLTVEKHTKAPERATAGAITGGILGGALGLLVGMGGLSLPGLGAFIAAGPIMATLGGSAVGGTLGLLIGAIVGAGIPEYEARKYETGLKAGKILISVHAETQDGIKRASDIMKREGAKHVSSGCEKAA